jgi:proteasome accessory factor C
MTSKLNAVESLSLLLSIAGYLTKNRNVPIDEMAKHFGVSEKIIDASVRTLGLSGVGSYGPTELFEVAWDALDEGIVDISDLPAIEEIPKLSSAEAAVFISGLQWLKQLEEFSDDEDVDRLLDLLSRGTNQQQAQVFEIQPNAYGYEFGKLREAIANQVRIHCDYTNLKGEHSNRQLDPLRLESRDQNWYLQAYCLTTGLVKFFRLDQMRNTKVTDTPISEEAKEAELKDELFEASNTDVIVTVDLEPEAFAIAAEFGTGEPPVELEDGRIRANLNIGYLPYLGKLIAQYGGAAVVVSPPQARAVVRDWALQTLGSKALSETELEED